MKADGGGSDTGEEKRRRGERRGERNWKTRVGNRRRRIRDN